MHCAGLQTANAQKASCATYCLRSSSEHLCTSVEHNINFRDSNNDLASFPTSTPTMRKHVLS